MLEVLYFKELDIEDLDLTDLRKELKERFLGTY